MPRSARWSIAELLDLEWFAAKGEIVSVTRGETKSETLLAWVRACRAQHRGPTPGDSFRRGWPVVRWLAAVAGILLGVSSAAALLRYPEPEPINAPLFFVCTIIVPYMFLVGGALAWLVGLPSLRGALPALARTLGARMAGERRDALEASAIGAEEHWEKHGPLFVRAGFVVLQQFALLFNLGALATLLAHVPFRDLRFGWESTLRTDAAQLHRVVTIVAAPWSWLDTRGAPSGRHVSESRYTHGERAGEVPDEAAHSWWPFLAWSIAVYGASGRAFLLVVAAGRLDRALRAPDLENRAVRALWRRIAGESFAAGATERAESFANTTNRTSPTGDCLLLAPEDFTEREIPGWNVRTTAAVQLDFPGANDVALQAVRATDATVVVALPAELPPIRAVANSLREIEAAAHGDVIAFVRGANAAHWQQLAAREKLRTLIEPWPAP